MKQSQRKRILVVDDDKTVTDSLHLILTDAGFEVVTAHTFAESNELLNNTQFDLVITSASGTSIFT